MNKRFLSLPASFLIALLAMAVASLLAACGKQIATPDQSSKSPDPISINLATATIVRTPTVTPTPARTMQASPTSVVLPFYPTVVAGKEASKKVWKEGDGYLRSGDFLAAEKAFNQAITLYPWNMEAYYSLRYARTAEQLNNKITEIDQLITDFDQQIEEQPKNSELYTQRGWQKLLKIANRGEPSVEIDQGDKSTTGESLSRTHLDLSAAISDFDKAILLDPKSAKAYHARGLAHHLEAILGITASPDFYLVDVEKLALVIKDYQQAIKLQPDRATAYNDLGTAYAQRAYNLRYDKNAVLGEEYNRAIEAYTRALELDPKLTSTIMNRGYASLYQVLSSKDDMKYQALREMLEQTMVDANAVLDAEPDSLWGHILKILSYSLLKEISTDASEQARIADEMEQTGGKVEEIASFLFLQYHFEDMLSRVFTLTYGPSITPSDGVLIGTKYCNPEDDFCLQVPELLSPNATMFAEKAASGDILIRFFDDMERWFTLQVHPGEIGDWEPGGWLENNMNEWTEFQPIVVHSQNGEAKGFRYYDTDHKAQCAAAVQYNQQNFYTATYCLLDKDETSSKTNFRMFASGYDIQYEPVEEVLESFLMGLEISVRP